ncbi:DUF3150 domain-containing protein [Mailhella sp.]
MEAILNTPIQVLDNILALNLDINIWSARAKLTAEDFGETELPPDELASLGSKKICDPEKLKVFNKLKKRAFTLLDRNGVRFLSGWAIPENKAGDIIAELCRIRDEFLTEKAAFIASYDLAIEDWINAHPSWSSIIAGSTVSREYVEKRIDISWQLYRVMPVMGIDSVQAMEESGLHDEVENLGGTLFYEITKDATDIWKKVFEGKTEVTHKALSPLKTMREKLAGLSFVEPHVAPVIEILDATLGRVPKRGLISGASLFMLQGLVSLLKDGKALLTQAEAMMASPTPENVLAAFFGEYEQNEPVLELEGEIEEAEPVFVPAFSTGTIDSLGLW